MSAVLLLTVVYWCARLTRYIRDQRKSLFQLHKMYTEVQSGRAAELGRQLVTDRWQAGGSSRGSGQFQALEQFQLDQSVFNCEVESIKLWMDAQLSAHGGFSLWGVYTISTSTFAQVLSALGYLIGMTLWRSAAWQRQLQAAVASPHALWAEAACRGPFGSNQVEGGVLVVCYMLLVYSSRTVWRLVDFLSTGQHRPPPVRQSDAASQPESATSVDGHGQQPSVSLESESASKSQLDEAAAELGRLLDSVGLGAFLEPLLERAVDSLHTLQLLDDSDKAGVGLRLGEIRRLDHALHHTLATGHFGPPQSLPAGNSAYDSPASGGFGTSRPSLDGKLPVGWETRQLLSSIGPPGSFTPPDSPLATADFEGHGAEPWPSRRSSSRSSSRPSVLLAAGRTSSRSSIPASLTSSSDTFYSTFTRPPWHRPADLQAENSLSSSLDGNATGTSTSAASDTPDGSPDPSEEEVEEDADGDNDMDSDDDDSVIMHRSVSAASIELHPKVPSLHGGGVSVRVQFGDSDSDSDVGRGGTRRGTSPLTAVGRPTDVAWQVQENKKRRRGLRPGFGPEIITLAQVGWLVAVRGTLFTGLLKNGEGLEDRHIWHAHEQRRPGGGGPVRWISFVRTQRKKGPNKDVELQPKMCRVAMAPENRVAKEVGSNRRHLLHHLLQSSALCHMPQIICTCPFSCLLKTK